MVLARILTPEQYGTVAIVNVFLSFFNLLADMGIGNAIVQYRDLGRPDLSGLMFFTVLLGVALSLLFCALSVPISLVYGDQELVPLCCVASIAVFFTTVNMVPNGVLLRDKDFRSIGVRLVVVSVVSGAAAVVLALLGWGCYALVVNSILTAALVFVWNAVRSGIAPTNRHFVAPLRRVARYSVFQGGFSVVNYFARNLDNLLVGALMGSAPLGYYDKAYRLMQYPLNYLTGIFSSVLQPYLSDWQDDRERVYEVWVAICRVIAIVGCLVAAVFLAFPEQLVLLMFGDQWLPAAPALAALALSLAPQMVNSTSGAVFQSIGRTDTLFRSGLICTAVSVVAILAGVSTGDLGLLGLAISLAYFVHFSVTVALLVRGLLGASAPRFLANFAGPVAGMVVALVAARAVAALLPGVAGAVAALAACVAAYVAVELALGQLRALSALRGLGGRDEERAKGDEDA